MIFRPEFIVLQWCGEEGNQGMRFSGTRFEAMIAACPAFLILPVYTTEKNQHCD